LFRYFHVTEARFGVLTNGLTYRFFTDLEHVNKMDGTPFFEFNILDFKDSDVGELKKFAKTSFDVDVILTTANELKYTRAIQKKLFEWMQSPSEEFVRLVSSDLYANRRFTLALKEQFTAITKRAFEQLIGESINERLKMAMTTAPSQAIEPVMPVATTAPTAELQTVTTPEEIEGFHIVRAILRDTVDPRRVRMRDAQSYCAILLDDNNRKPICRLRFNNTDKLCLGVFGDKKEEERVPLSAGSSKSDLANFVCHR
jgi:hypothetical protein